MSYGFASSTPQQTTDPKPSRKSRFLFAQDSLALHSGQMPPPIRAVIFDFDGLVVDTESTGYLTWKEIFDEHGHHLPIERYAQVVGSGFNVS